MSGVNAAAKAGCLAAGTAADADSIDGLGGAAGLAALPRAAGALAGRRHAKARAATVRRDLVTVTARHGRDRLILHLPEGRHRETEWRCLSEAACGPPAKAA